ncbi:TPA: glycosyltransferase family 2 protein [Vibrio vulnificus]|nr:glycosyltransferase family 2 protein [Vibrio vulnificus]
MKMIDVLIPMYNSEDTIRECVLSVIQQTIKSEVNIIICNDASNDDSLSIVCTMMEKYPNIRLLENEYNLGYLSTFNRLLEESSSEYVAFLDADDLYFPKKLENQFDFLESNMNIDVVGCNYVRSDNKKNYISKPSNLPTEHATILASFINGDDVICGSSLMIRRNVIDSVGGYRTYFKGKVGEDIDWFGRIIQKHIVANIPYPGYVYRMSLSSLTRKVSYEVEELHVHQLINYLFRKRINNNTLYDDVDHNDNIALSEFFSKFESEYNNKPALLYSKCAFNHAVNKNYKQCYRDFILCFSGKRDYFLIVKTAFLLFMVISLPHHFLLKIKDSLNLKHIARKFLK